MFVFSFYPYFSIFFPSRNPAHYGNLLGKTVLLFYSFFTRKLCASSFQPECLFSSLRTWDLPLDSYFLPLYISGMELRSASCFFQVCSRASKLKTVGTIYNCVLWAGRKHVLPHSFQAIASWAGTSNDSDSEAVCFNDGNYLSLQVQN